MRAPPRPDAGCDERERRDGGRDPERLEDDASADGRLRGDEDERRDGRGGECKHDDHERAPHNDRDRGASGVPPDCRVRKLADDQQPGRIQRSETVETRVVDDQERRVGAGRTDEHNGNERRDAKRDGREQSERGGDAEDGDDETCALDRERRIRDDTRQGGERDGACGYAAGEGAAERRNARTSSRAATSPRSSSQTATGTPARSNWARRTACLSCQMR